MNFVSVTSILRLKSFPYFPVGYIFGNALISMSGVLNLIASPKIIVISKK
jgi:hypothetical protein